MHFVFEGPIFVDAVTLADQGVTSERCVYCGLSVTSRDVHSRASLILCVVLAPSGLYYFVSRFLEFPVKIHLPLLPGTPELVTMFMSADFPGVFLTLLPPNSASSFSALL